MDWGGLADSAPAGIAAFVTIGTAVIGGAIKLAKAWRSARDSDMKSVKSVAPMPPSNPFGHAPPPTDPYLLARLHALESQADRRQEWVEQDLRRALAEVSTDLAQKTRALLVERERRKTAEVRLLAKEQQLATLEDALTRVTRERDQAELELAAARAREVEAAAAIPPMGEDDKRTPMRPPAPRRAP